MCVDGMLKRLRVPMMAGLAGAAIGAAATEVLRQNNGVLVRVKAADPLPQTYSPQLETTQRITYVAIIKCRTCIG